MRAGRGIGALRHRGRWTGAAVALLSAGLASSALAQSDVQIAPDGVRVLISKDVDGERWAITVDPASATVNGNVFRTDGSPPQFVSCLEMVRVDGQVKLRCRGTRECGAWDDLGEVVLPESFFEPGPVCSDTSVSTAVAHADAVGGASQAGVPSALRLTPDENNLLISKDVGGQRWAITRNVDGGTVTGNVFFPGGGPAQFVSCEEVDFSPGGITLACRGADACRCAPCSASDWTPLAEVVVPSEFLGARRCSAEGTLPRPAGQRLQPSRDLAEFGEVVALSGDRAVVQGTGAEDGSGRIFVFEREAGVWRLVAEIASPVADESGLFGSNLAIEEETVIVGGLGDVFFFERRSGIWSEVARFATPQVDDDRYEVMTVAIDGEVAVVGAGHRRHDERAIVYERSGGAWRETATLRADQQEDGFAGSVDVKGGTVVVGARGSIQAGGVYLFERGSDGWKKVVRLSGSGGLAADGFGSAVAFSGDRVVVGAESGGRRLDRVSGGAAYVFERSGSSWSEVARLTSCAPEVRRFGGVVAVSGDRVIVSPRDFYEGSAGDVSVFERTPDGWLEQGRIVVSDSYSTSREILAVSGSTALVGAPDAGVAWSFDLDTAELVPPAPCPSPEPPSNVFPQGGWSVESPEDHGMSRVLLDRAREYAFQPAKNTQGVVVVRHGVIVAEWYEAGRDETWWAASWSAAKSFAGALVGIAIGEGLIENVDVSMARFIPSWAGTDKEAMTLRDVLTMSSGLQWTEDYSTAPTVLSDIARLASTESDHLAYVLSKPLEHPPGTFWRYSSADTLLLAAVIEAATGLTAAEYADQVLFGPLGMGPIDWWSDVAGRTLTYCCIDTPTREFAKFGLLYARGGRWVDRQVVPESFVDDSTNRTSKPFEFYGYQWWLRLQGTPPFPSDVFLAEGYDGQFIYVMPSLDLVVVRNGHYDKDPGPPIADPNLFARYPAAGLGQGRGTVPPDGWDDRAFIRPILESIFAHRDS